MIFWLVAFAGSKLTYILYRILFILVGVCDKSFSISQWITTIVVIIAILTVIIIVLCLIACMMLVKIRRNILILKASTLHHNAKNGQNRSKPQPKHTASTVCKNVTYRETEGVPRSDSQPPNLRLKEAAMYEEPIVNIPESNNVQNPAYGVTPTPVGGRSFFNNPTEVINQYDAPFKTSSCSDVVMQRNSAYK